MLKHKTPLILAAALALVAYAPALAQEEMQQEQPQTVIAVLEASGNHSQFLEAIRAAGLVEQLQGEGTFTVFAPTDDAWSAIPEEKRNELMSNPDKLRELVSYHISPTAIRTADLLEPTNVETLQGSSIQVSSEAGAVTLQAPAPAAEVGGVEAQAPPAAITATVVSPDQEASNGVIHSVDTVLLIEG